MNWGLRKAKIEELRKGDLILVRWFDANEVRGSLQPNHEAPEIFVKDLGIFLGVSGTKRKHILIGKDVVENVTDWGATRIPVELVDSVTLIMTREQIAPSMPEIRALTRRVQIRRYRRVGRH